MIISFLSWIVNLSQVFIRSLTAVFQCILIQVIRICFWISSYLQPPTIKDINGALIHTEQIYSDSQAIDVSSMASQLYFVQVEGQVMKLFKN